MRSARTTRPVSDRGRLADTDWWRQAVVYQVYPRSFADSDGNGLGDLQGVISRVPYLADLGIDAVWLGPFYPSALADGGYDVDDYRDVDPRLGTLADFDEMTARLHARRIRVIVDIVPNHTSSRHAWFREALAAPKGLPARSRYIFRDGGTSPRLDRGLGLRRARAAILLMLALPGSAYLYQGEELGLHEVPDIPPELVQDPSFARSRGAEKGRDGCRVPLPWTADGPSFGFGAGPAHLPQPAWFGPLSVQAQERDPASTLSLYRDALRWRRTLQTAESMEPMPGTNGQVLHFTRPGGWRCVTNFGPGPVPLPYGTVILSSAPFEGSQLPADTTAWLLPEQNG